MPRRSETIKTITVDERLYERVKYYCKANNISIKSLTEIILTDILSKLEMGEIGFAKESKLVYKTKKKP